MPGKTSQSGKSGDAGSSGDGENARLATVRARGYARIATEEAFAPAWMLERYQSLLARHAVDDPGFQSLWGFYLGSRSPRATQIITRLKELGAQRLADMDASGIDRQIISLTSPGVQVFDAATATALARDANDELSAAVRSHPERYAGLTAVAPQDPRAAASEIERGMRQLGMKGVIINSHTLGEYLDDPKFSDLLAAAEAENAPIYLHPNTPSKGLITPLLECGLDGAIYGFGVETGMHMLRIVVGGVFDRYPRLKVVLGHLGEALPFWLYRLDYMHQATVASQRYAHMRPLQRRVSDYLRENVYVTTSGMPWAPAIRFCQEVLGMDRVLYAMDYPYQFLAEEVTLTDQVPLSEPERKMLFQLNAERAFSL
jgi:5-carboxyvanillate decarboxylase